MVARLTRYSREYPSGSCHRARRVGLPVVSVRVQMKGGNPENSPFFTGKSATAPSPGDKRTSEKVDGCLEKNWSVSHRQRAEANICARERASAQCGPRDWATGPSRSTAVALCSWIAVSPWRILLDGDLEGRHRAPSRRTTGSAVPRSCPYGYWDPKTTSSTVSRYRSATSLYGLAGRRKLFLWWMRVGARQKPFSLSHCRRVTLATPLYHRQLFRADFHFSALPSVSATHCVYIRARSVSCNKYAVDWNRRVPYRRTSKFEP